MSTPTPFGMLFLLPPELRVKVYREIVIAGSVRFLESSKAIHSEAIDIVSQDGVCRLEFDVFKPIIIFPVHDSTSSIRNLEIRLNYIETARLNLQLESPMQRVVQHMVVSLSRLHKNSLRFRPPAQPVPRRSCKILVECHRNYASFEQLPTKIFDTIRHLTGFETLVFTVSANRYTAETRQRMTERMCGVGAGPSA